MIDLNHHTPFVLYGWLGKCVERGCLLGGFIDEPTFNRLNL